jgi:UDP-N-acetylglucosamine 2-epimerase (non-hydrolysing)
VAVVLAVVGTRPNIMKMAPVVADLRRRPGIRTVVVHTGQHYDASMSRVFLDQLAVPEPDHNLEVGSGSHTRQTARVLERLEPVLRRERPDMVLVAGDVNSTMAAALAASQQAIRVGHVEAGLRSFDRTMPEERNRVLTDALSDDLFIHSPEARDNLLAEGRPKASIHPVGNTMIDTLVAMRERIDGAGVPERLGLSAGTYLVATLHRPALVDGPLLPAALTALRELELPVVLPVHPRTRGAIDRAQLPTDPVVLLEPLGYVEFLSLVASARGVLTDSGGLQEETTWLGIPCFTLRDNTERPVTVSVGTNTVLGLDPNRIRELPGLLANEYDTHRVPDGWDGRAAARIGDVLEGALVA